MEQVVAQHGRLDILVNNAGGSPHADAASASPRFIDAILKLNLHAPIYLARPPTPRWSRRAAATSSTSPASRASAPARTAAYGAAKAGLLNLTQSLAQEWGRDHIRVNAIIAGLMQTDNAEATYGDAGRRAVGRSMPLGRMGLGEDIAGAVLWLCSDLASWVSGARINVDGGGERPYFLDLVKENRGQWDQGTGLCGGQKPPGPTSGTASPDPAGGRDARPDAADGAALYRSTSGSSDSALRAAAGSALPPPDTRVSDAAARRAGRKVAAAGRPVEQGNAEGAALRGFPPSSPPATRRQQP